jgi:hypothetical protein
MYWHTRISWIVKNPTLHNTAKDSCQIGTQYSDQNTEIVRTASRTRKLFAGIDSTGLSHGQASYYYTKRFRLQKEIRQDIYTR